MPSSRCSGEAALFLGTEPSGGSGSAGHHAPDRRPHLGGGEGVVVSAVERGVRDFSPISQRPRSSGGTKLTLAKPACRHTSMTFSTLRTFSLPSPWTLIASLLVRSSRLSLRNFFRPARPSTGSSLPS